MGRRNGWSAVPNKKNQKYHQLTAIRRCRLDKYFDISVLKITRNPPDCEESADYPVG